MKQTITLLSELNRLLPIPPGEECRHALTLHPDGRLAVVVWVREVAVVPSRKGWRQFFFDDADMLKPATELAAEIATTVTLTHGESLQAAMEIRPDRIFTTRDGVEALGERLARWPNCSNRRVIL